DQGILAYTLRNNKEVRDPAEFFDRIPDVQADPKMVAIAEKIIEQLEGPFDPSEFNDRYEEALRKLIAEKEASHGVTAPAPEPQEAEVIDLMEALRRSLGEGGPRRQSEPRGGAKKSAPRKTPARKRAS
ncbi:MAG: Ku protein, partial [Phenylobacterium sp.]